MCIVGQVLIKNSDSADFGKMTYPLWTVAPGETIETLSFNNQISVQEFLIFNDKYI